MREYDLSFEVLKDVLKNKTAFATATKAHGRQIKADLRPLISSLCGLFLRNYQLISTISEFTFKTKEIEPMIYIGLVYMNNSYKKALDANESIKYLSTKLALYQIKFDEEVRSEFQEVIKSKRDYLDKKLENNGARYLSCKSNVPLWVIKMLFRQYDRDIAKKTISNIVKMPLQYAVKNTRLSEQHEEELLTRFSLVKDNLYEFKDETSIRKDQLVRLSVVLPIQKAEYEMTYSLPNIEFGSVTAYFEDKNSFYVELLNKYLGVNKVNIVTPNPKNNKDLFSVIKPKKFENLFIIEAPESELVAHLSEKQDLVLFMPRSSNLELLRRTPEYGIFFDTNDLDQIVEDQFNKLIDITQHVRENGYLVYAVPTFNIKETLVMTNKFLGQVKGFKLVKENTFFPYEKENSIFYVAIFKKDK